MYAIARDNTNGVLHAHSKEFAAATSWNICSVCTDLKAEILECSARTGSKSDHRRIYGVRVEFAAKLTTLAINAPWALLCRPCACTSPAVKIIASPTIIGGGESETTEKVALYLPPLCNECMEVHGKSRCSRAGMRACRLHASPCHLFVEAPALRAKVLCHAVHAYQIT